MHADTFSASETQRRILHFNPALFHKSMQDRWLFRLRYKSVPNNSSNNDDLLSARLPPPASIIRRPAQQAIPLNALQSTFPTV